jgi:hypothetical protein
MDKPPEESQMVFVLPQSSISAPVVSSLEERLNMALVEIGCKPTRKRRQLKEKKQGIYFEWGHYFRRKIDWRPHIYRLMVYFDDMPLDYADSRVYEPELILRYTTFPADIWYNLDEKDKEWVTRYERNPKTREEFIKIINERSPEEAYAFVVAERNPRYNGFRGKLLELIVAKDITRILPENMFIVHNPEVRILYRGYQKKVEIDDILLFYGDSPFSKFTENLAGLQHIELTRHIK